MGGLSLQGNQRIIRRATASGRVTHFLSIPNPVRPPVQPGSWELDDHEDQVPLQGTLRVDGVAHR